MHKVFNPILERDCIFTSYIMCHFHRLLGFWREKWKPHAPMGPKPIEWDFRWFDFGNLNAYCLCASSIREPPFLHMHDSNQNFHSSTLINIINLIFNFLNS